MTGVSPAERRRAFAALFAAGTLWGATFLVGKLVLRSVGPTWLIAERFALAVLVLLPFVPWRALRRTLHARPADARLAGQVLLGAFLAGPVTFVLGFEGLARTTASGAALLVAVAPPLLAVGAALVDGERAGRAAWTAIAVSAVGVALLVGSPGPGRTLTGDALCAAGMVGAVAWTLVSRRIARRLGTVAAVVVQFACGVLMLVPLALVREGPPPPMDGPTALGVVFLGVVCTAVTFSLFTWGVQRVEAARAGVISNIEPVIGSVLGVAVLGEHLGPWAVAGGALLVAAALLATRAEPVPDAPATDAPAPLAP